MTAVTATAVCSKPPISGAAERLIFLSMDLATAAASPELRDVDTLAWRRIDSPEGTKFEDDVVYILWEW